MTISSVFTSIAHWIYASQLLEVVLLFPLFLDPNQLDSEKKLKKIRWVMYAANSYFFLQVAIWAGFMFAYRDQKDEARWYYAAKFDSMNKLLPAILIIISIVIFRRKFTSKKVQKVFAREKKIVLVHLVIFISFIIVFGIFVILCDNLHK